MLCHFDKSHSELTTPADSTLNSDWLEQLQVRRMLMDMMWTAVHTHTNTHKDKNEQIGHTHIHTKNVLHKQCIDTSSTPPSGCVCIISRAIMVNDAIVTLTHLISN